MATSVVLQRARRNEHERRSQLESRLDLDGGHDEAKGTPRKSEETTTKAKQRLLAKLLPEDVSRTQLFFCAPIVVRQHDEGAFAKSRVMN